MCTALWRPRLFLQLLQHPGQLLLFLPPYWLRSGAQWANVPGSVNKPPPPLCWFQGAVLFLLFPCISDIDECAAGIHTCSASESCFNIQGGFRCLSFTCPENFHEVARGWVLVSVGCEPKKVLSWGGVVRLPCLALFLNLIPLPVVWDWLWHALVFLRGFGWTVPYSLSALHPMSVSFFPFQPLRACNLQVHAGPCLVFLAPAENLLLQHQLPHQHPRPGQCIPNGTLQFSAGRQSLAHYSLRRQRGILWHRAPGAQRRNLPTPYHIPTPWLLPDCGVQVDSLWQHTLLYGKDCSVCDGQAAHPALKNISPLDTFELKGKVPSSSHTCHYSHAVHYPSFFLKQKPGYVFIAANTKQISVQ